MHQLCAELPKNQNCACIRPRAPTHQRHGFELMLSILYLLHKDLSRGKSHIGHACSKKLFAEGFQTEDLKKSERETEYLTSTGQMWTTTDILNKQLSIYLHGCPRCPRASRKLTSGASATAPAKPYASTNQP